MHQMAKKLYEQLDHVSFRRAFIDDPVAALGSAGLDPKQIPNDQLDALTDMSLDELTLLADLSKNMRAMESEEPSAATAAGCHVF